jgi:hypothetical protein
VKKVFRLLWNWTLNKCHLNTNNSPSAGKAQTCTLGRLRSAEQPYTFSSVSKHWNGGALSVLGHMLYLIIPLQKGKKIVLEVTVETQKNSHLAGTT